MKVAVEWKWKWKEHVEREQQQQQELAEKPEKNGEKSNKVI